MVCGACGADLPSGAATCPSCGEAVELSDATRVCGVCGYRNVGAAPVCESCGARLPGGVTTLEPLERRRSASGTGRPAGGRANESRSRKKEGSRVESWQIISGVAVIAMVAVILYYLLLPGESGTKPGPVSLSQSQAVASTAEIDALQQAVDAHPRDAGAIIRLANTLHDNGMLPRAIDNYNAYLDLQPGDPNARVDLGICYDQLALQDTTNAARYFALAVQEMETAAKNTPTHQPAAFNLGIVNLHMGNLEESNRWFKRAVALDPNSEMGKRAQQILQQHTFPR
jgi:tetratricopeptide (TPR) repeat protein